MKSFKRKILLIGMNGGMSHGLGRTKLGRNIYKLRLELVVKYMKRKEQKPRGYVEKKREYG